MMEKRWYWTKTHKMTQFSWFSILNIDHMSILMWLIDAILFSWLDMPSENLHVLILWNHRTVEIWSNTKKN